jgi:SAM-dependent methyltransferase
MPNYDLAAKYVKVAYKMRACLRRTPAFTAVESALPLNVLGMGDATRQSDMSRENPSKPSGDVDAQGKSAQGNSAQGNSAQGNDAQVEYWNGRAGEIWTRNQARLDRAFAPLTYALVEKAAPARGEKIVDVGCGCGDLALALASRVGHAGHVMGIDVSKPMLERAQARANAVAGDHGALAWVEADATSQAFVAEYDLLASRFGVMFFADPIAAFGNLRRALKPGGRFAFLCWRPLDCNPWLAFPLAATRELLGPQPPAEPFAPGPFALSDPTRVEKILREAGYCEVSTTLVDGSVLLGRADAGVGAEANAQAVDDALELALRTGPVAALLREADEATRLEARQRVAAALKTIVADGEVRLPGSCWLYTGRGSAV